MKKAKNTVPQDNDEDYNIVLTPETREIVAHYLNKQQEKHARLMQKRGKATA